MGGGIAAIRWPARLALLDARGQSRGGVALVPERARGASARAALVHARGLPRGLARHGAHAASCAALDRIRRRVEALFGVAHRGADRGVGDRGAGRRRGARVPPRRGVPAGAPRDDARAAVAAAPRRLPRRRRAGARRPLGAERADRRDRRRAAGVRAAGHRPGAARQRADPRAGPRAGRRRRGGPQRTRRCSGWARCPRSPSSRAAPSCCSRRWRRCAFPVDAVLHARWLGNREAITRVRRRIVDADVAFSEQLHSAHGPLSYAAEENRQLARELDAYLQSHERPPLLNVRDLARRRRAVGASELEQRVEALRHRFGTVALHRPLGLQPALFLDHLPRADGGHGARLRRRADDRAVRRADADRHAPGRLRARRLHRPHAGRRRAAGALRHHRGLADRAAAVDPARRHARVGQDDRRRAARLPGRAPRQRWWSTSTPSPTTTSRACPSSTGACT